MNRLKLGKLDPKDHPKTLLFSKYLLPGAPLPPHEKSFWEYKVDPATIGMYGNDQVGDCVFADIAHYIILITAHTGKPVFPDPADIIKAYSALTGYDPSQTDANGNNPTDNGTAFTDAMNYWQTTGIAGHKISGWAKIDHTNRVHMNQGVFLFLGVHTGVQLPMSAQDQFSAGKNWEVDDSEIEGGHAILRSGMGREGQNYESWGKGDQKSSIEWEAKYADEAYIVFTDGLIDIATGVAPNSLNADALVSDLALLRG